MNFPLGNAVLALIALAVCAGAGLVTANLSRSDDGRAPDLTFAIFSKEHAAAYKLALPAFEEKYHCKISLEVVDIPALQGRLQSAMQVGAAVPDMVELNNDSLGFFIKGPVQDIGFIDLTRRVKDANLAERLVAARLVRHSTRGHIFALPHDVHPVQLAYRRDLVEQMGIDVNKLTTWDEFTRVGREVVRNNTHDGTVSHYMIDLTDYEPWGLRMLLLQYGGALFDAQNKVTFDSEAAVTVACWYARALTGSTRIAFTCGWGQNLAKALSDGLCLFYVCPDWRTAQFEMDVPGVNGKMALMPLPAWTPGGARTSTWGSTGLAITKRCRNVELAWKLAMYLYYDPAQLGPRFEATNILPPVKEVWTQPQFLKPRPFYSNIALGQSYAALTQQVPPESINAYTSMAETKLFEAYSNIAVFRNQHGDDGLEAFARTELRRCADQVRRVMERNVFYKSDASKVAALH